MPVIGPIAQAGSPPTQHKQPSRRGKKAWRKNVDIRDVVKGLEMGIEEKIQGHVDGIIAEKTSDELFTLDVRGDTTLRAETGTKRLSRALKADHVLASRSAVAPLSGRKRPGQVLGEAESGGSALAKRQRTGYVPYKELMRLRQVADGEVKTVMHVEDAEHDIWDAPAEVPTKVMIEDAPTKVAVKQPKTMKQQPISLVASGKRVRPVSKPLGGDSYNPAFADYEERLTTEGNKALEVEKKRLLALEAEKALAEAAARSAAEAERAEARAELSEWEDESAWEGLGSGTEDASAVTAKRPKRKTQAQRNKIERRKEEERRQRHEKMMKAKLAQVDMAKKLAAAMDAKERERMLAVEQVANLAGDDSTDEGGDHHNLKLRRKQLGKYRLPEKDLELVLPDELQDSLRLLKPEGNLLKDRYRSFLVRGAVESRKHRPFAKKARTKATEKWGHKDFTLW